MTPATPISRADSANGPNTDQLKPPTTDLVFDPEIVKALEKAKMLGKVDVGTELRNPHRLIIATRDGFRQAVPDQHKLVPPRHRDHEEVLHVLVATNGRLESAYRRPRTSFLRIFCKECGAINRMPLASRRVRLHGPLVAGD
jgi:hypothetical protein